MVAHIAPRRYRSENFALPHGVNPADKSCTLSLLVKLAGAVVCQQYGTVTLA